VVVDVKQTPAGMTVGGGQPVADGVVIAADYFKSLLAGWRNLIGGEVKTHQTMLSRARREARLRMVEEARGQGSNPIVNVRFEWSDGRARDRRRRDP
jgi:uncharacterized protein YbjQ (UPF0145 family)